MNNARIDQSNLSITTIAVGQIANGIHFMKDNRDQCIQQHQISNREGTKL